MSIKRNFGVLIGAAFVLGATACAPTLRVSPLDSEHAYKNGYDVYYLPQTVLNVTFTLDRGTYTPGPYAAYAESLLGIAGEVPQPGDYWSIDSIAVESVQEPDFKSAFAVKQPEGKAAEKWLTLNRMGLLLPANATQLSTAQGQGEPTEQSDWPAFSDLSTAQFVADKSSIFYSTVQQDTTFVRVPVQRNVVVKESVAEKAKQAADLIFSLRSKRVELVSGDAEVPAAPGVLRDMLDELDRIEAQYLSLFIGRWEHSKQRVQLRYTPTAGENSSMLCRFSKQSGIRPTMELAATPMLITVTPLEGALAAPSDRVRKPLSNALYYRPARTAEVTITLLRDQLLSVRVPISQLGPIVPIYSVPTK